jgi:hypothetical protein
LVPVPEYCVHHRHVKGLTYDFLALIPHHIHPIFISGLFSLNILMTYTSMCWSGIQKQQKGNIHITESSQSIWVINQICAYLPDRYSDNRALVKTGEKQLMERCITQAVRSAQNRINSFSSTKLNANGQRL